MSKEGENNVMITILFIFWMLISALLVFSIIGMLLFAPGSNGTSYYKPISERRSTWCTIGISLLNKLIK